VGVSNISWLSDVGDFGSMSSPPTTTSSPTSTTSTTSTSSGLSFPTNTAINNGNVLCFSDYNGDGKYQSFTLADAKDVIDAVCANDYVLDPGNAYRYVENGGNNIYVSISWAEDQSGFRTEVDFPLGVPLVKMPGISH
jgi:hypothetical protein